MVIRGNIRGNGQQLAHYLLKEGGNDRIRVLDVAGRATATDAYLHQTLHGMALTAELTKSQKGLFHAQINPAYAEDQRMTDDDWSKAADILSHELGYDGQRRVIVLHTKKNRTHAHVVFERYDQKMGKVIDNKFSRLGQDRARKEMERVFAQQPTPHRNPHRPELKERLTNLWQETETGAEFIQKVHDNGYLLAEGVPRHPFMVVDENGRSFDLVRQLKGVRIKEVRQRLRDAELIPEKEAIEIMRQRQEGGSDASNNQQPTPDQMPERTKRFAQFWEMGAELTQEDAETQSAKRRLAVARTFLEASPELTASHQEDSHSEIEVEQVDTETQAKTEDTTREKHRATLQAFMQEGEEFGADTRPDADQQRQQKTARQFFDNQDAFADDRAKLDQEPKHSPPSTGLDETKDATSDDERLQKLMQEQKDIRERARQRNKTRTR